MYNYTTDIKYHKYSAAVKKKSMWNIQAFFLQRVSV